jgi:hypothetical protein
MMAAQARSSVTIMGFDTHMILEAVPASHSPRRTAHRAINRSLRHYAEAVLSMGLAAVTADTNGTAYLVDIDPQSTTAEAAARAERAGTPLPEFEGGAWPIMRPGAGCTAKHPTTRATPDP